MLLMEGIALQRTINSIKWKCCKGLLIFTGDQGWKIRKLRYTEIVRCGNGKSM